MRRIFLLICVIAHGVCAMTYAQENNNAIFKIAGNVEYNPSADTSSLIRNPCCGWGVYDDAAGEVADASQYWLAQDSSARKYASFFYVRWRWSDMEPEE
ncbi:MAG: hypothetical protein RR388_05090, partial [Rikenellaceae bacterium]